MKKLFAILAVLATAMLSLAGPAAAQTPTGTMSIDPTSVDAAGEVEFSVELGSFSPGLAVFVLPCTAPEGGDMALFDAAGACDQSQLTPVVIDDDGNASATATYMVDDNGLVIVAGDAAQSEFAIAIVPPPGAATGGDLAETGVETGLLAVIAGTMVVGGAMVVRQSRKY